MTQSYLILNETARNGVIEAIKHEKLGAIVEIISAKERRSGTLNRAMHKYFEWLSVALNDAGIWLEMDLSGVKVKIPWTHHSIKDKIWRPIQIAITGKESTADLKSNEPGEIYTILNQSIGEVHGIFVEWPSQELQYQEAMGRARNVSK